MINTNVTSTLVWQWCYELRLLTDRTRLTVCWVLGHSRLTANLKLMSVLDMYYQYSISDRMAPNSLVWKQIRQLVNKQHTEYWKPITGNRPG